MPPPERFRLIVAVHLFLVREGQVLLLRRANTGYEDGNYSVVAGHLDGGEEVLAATAREAEEEVGVTIAPATLRVIGVMHRKAERVNDSERIDFFLEATAWEGEPDNCEPGKCDQLRWVAFDDLPDNIVPYVRRGLENYRRGTWFDSFGWCEPSG